MPENILKGVFREGEIVASVVQKDSTARILVKGAEPSAPGDPAFLETLGRVVTACKQHVAEFSERELCAVLVSHPEQAEHIEFSDSQIEQMGLTRISAMDGNCGMVVRACEVEPPPLALAYGSLIGGGDLATQPGMTAVPPDYERKTYRDLTDPQKKVFEVAVQLMGRTLLRLVCLVHENLRMVACLKDYPPPRARSVLVPLGLLADQLAKGTAPEEIGKRLHVLRS